MAKAPLADALFRRLVWSRMHFPETEMRFLNGLPAGAIDVAIDVGAAKGCYAWILARISRVVFAFEPGTKHRQLISRVAFGTNIKVIGAAVGSETGTAKMYTPGDDREALHSATLSTGNPVAGHAAVRVESVAQVTLDGFLKSALKAGRSVDFLKIDVEGYEQAVIDGGLNTLKTFHPLVVCEIEARHNADYRKVFSILRSLGYSCYVFHGRKATQFDGVDIEQFQTDAALSIRLANGNDPDTNRYINNFIFQHPQSKIKVSA